MKKIDARATYQANYKKYTDSSRSSVSCQKYADSYVTQRDNNKNNDEIDSHFNLDNSFDCASSRATTKTKTTVDYENRRIDEPSRSIKANQTKSRFKIIRNESPTKTRMKHISDDDDEHTLKNGSDLELEIDTSLLKFEEERIEFDKLPTVNFEETFEDGQSFRIFLSQIHSPYKFWFQLKDDAEQLNDLMSSLEYDLFCNSLLFLLNLIKKLSTFS